VAVVVVTAVQSFVISWPSKEEHMRNHSVREGDILFPKWETPSFVELKMDAEINAYQDDFGSPPDLQEGSRETLTETTSTATGPLHPQSES
jgi:hypothetical protein